MEGFARDGVGRCSHLRDVTCDNVKDKDAMSQEKEVQRTEKLGQRYKYQDERPSESRYIKYERQRDLYF